MSELPTTAAPIGGFDWTNRRKWIWRVSVFCMVVVGYCLWCGEDL